jgi:two-component system, NarL family, response regulator DegU
MGEEVQAMISTMEQVLSKRELEVLELIAKGNKNCEIAETLEIKEVTVRFHIGNILDKLKVKSRTEAAFHAFKKGWIEV